MLASNHCKTVIAVRVVHVHAKKGDSIFVPHIGPVAAIAGAVKRPGIYELKGESSVSGLISLAGGLLPSANRSAISVVRFTGDQRTLIDGHSQGVGSIQSMNLVDGDLVRVDTVRDCVPNEVKIEGEVRYPGSYSIERVPTLKELINRAQLLPDTDLYYGRIYRTGPGGVQENMIFSVKDVLDGATKISLKGLDDVVLYPFGQNLQAVNFNAFPNTVTLEGTIRYPGMYAWHPGMKLSDILSKGNYLVDTNVQYGVVVQQEIGSDKQNLITFSRKAVTDGANNVTLQPVDRVEFFSKTIQKPIEVSGAVRQSQVVQYYKGIDLMDVLRTITLDSDPTKMEVYVYRGIGSAVTTTGSSTLQAGPAPLIGAAPTMATGQPAANATNASTPAVSAQNGQASALENAASSGASANTTTSSNAGSPQAPQNGAGAQGSAAGSTTQSQTAKPFVVYLDDLLTQQSVQSVPLEPGDRLVFAKVGPNEKVPQVIVRGQVNQPGAYLWKPGMKLSDVLKDAGGYTAQAYAEGLVLLRQSAARLQRQELDRAAQELQVALQQNIRQAAAGASAAQTSVEQAAQAQLKALQTRSQMCSGVSRFGCQGPFRSSLPHPKTSSSGQAMSSSFLKPRPTSRSSATFTIRSLWPTVRG